MPYRIAILSAWLTLTALVSAQTNLVKNPDFSAGDMGTAGWRVVQSQPTAAVVPEGDGAPARALRVDIAKDGGDSYGEISQKVKISPFTRYRFSGTLKGTKANVVFFQIKLTKSDKELKRISTDGNGTDWARVTKELTTGDADGMIVLCRYRQSAKNKWVGESGWYADLLLEDLGRDPEAPAPATLTPGAQGAIDATNRPTVNPAPLPAGTDIYVTPDGAGEMTGADWENALAGNGDGALQAAWDATGTANTCHLGSGVYLMQSVDFTTGGHDVHHRKSLMGVDTGDGLPIMRSTWDVADPAKGQEFLLATTGVSHWRVAHLRLENYRIGVRIEGQNVDLSVIDVDMASVRDGIILNGAASTIDPSAGSHDILIQDCDFRGFTKRAVRMVDGVYQVRLVNCHADAGGKDFATERFQMCFHIGSESVPCHDIAYIGCSASNAYDDAGDKYWNGDGFAAERKAYDITYTDCIATDHTDGGWDDKSFNPTLVNCVALRNKRNFRFWSAGGVTLVRCVGADSLQRGGSGNSSGLYVCKGAQVTAIDCMFYDNNIQVDVDLLESTERRTRVELINCVIGSDKREGVVLSTVDETCELVLTNTRTYLRGTDGELPLFEALGTTDPLAAAATR